MSGTERSGRRARRTIWAMSQSGRSTCFAFLTMSWAKERARQERSQGKGTMRSHVVHDCEGPEVSHCC